jgi:hypothetical protein
MICKRGVDLARVHPVVERALPIMAAARLEAVEALFAADMVVTAGAEGQARDGVHAAESLHYPENCPGRLGLAVDLRTRDFVDAFAAKLAAELGPAWDVVVERDHIHVERDARRVPLTKDEGADGANHNGG